MNDKTISIVSYITIIGWFVAYFQYKDKDQKSPLVSYHLTQGLGVFIFAFVLNIVVFILIAIVPSLTGVLSIVGVVPLLFIIFGIIAANNETTQPVPLIGKFFEGRFNF